MSPQFLHSYLVAVLFVLGIGLGALFFVLVHTLARAGWHVVIRRQAENMTVAIPLGGLLAIPLALHLDQIYPWVREPLAHKAVYLNTEAFIARSLFYLLGWSLIAWWFRRQSLKQDETGDVATTRRLQAASAPALIFFAFTVTFASFDWLMSLDPHWYSSIFGVYFFAGTIVSYFAVQGLLAAPQQLTAEHRHGLGKLLFGFVCFWAYIAFSQYLLIWYANLPEETIWYRHRFDGTWFGLSAFLAVGHFVLPFFYLLPQSIKKNKTLLAAGSAWLLLMHYLDLYWVVMPNFHPGGIAIHWLDVATLAGATALLSGAYVLLSKRTEEIPISDPRLAESLGFDNA